MIKYPKIQSIYKRDGLTHKFIESEWSLPEFDYLQNNIWECTEKIDGTNIRVDWDGKETITYGGRTDNASIPALLITKLQSIFSNVFKKNYIDLPMTLFGEGYGAKIQKGGGNYISDGVDFILFDMMIDNWWLQKKDILDIGTKLGIKVVPVVKKGTLAEAIKFIKSEPKSTFGNFVMEGIVVKTEIGLKARNGKRIITKMKCKDWIN